jgi:hypothetical protein
MSKTSADLVKGWQADRTKLQLEITGLKIEERSRSASEREMTAKIAALDSLIDDFSRCDTFPLTFFHDDKPHSTPIAGVCGPNSPAAQSAASSPASVARDGAQVRKRPARAGSVGGSKSA